MKKNQELEMMYYQIDLMNLTTLGSVILPNITGIYEKRVNNLLTCVGNMGINYKFNVYADYVTITLV